ncbi:hypothetical protein BDQ17DRAFT_1432913 [Cyathus striatus]|nr:hypothetical protein BDQ17DRAFT_1432913 [Cyathus striatus]
MLNQQLGGSEQEQERVLLLLDYLEGEAVKWYRRHVISPTSAKSVRTFEEVIIGLYNQFIEEAMNQHRRDTFYSVRYHSVAGLQGLHDTMTNHAQSMPMPLDDYSFTQAFINTMPEDMRRKLIEDMLLTPEVNMADDFLAIGRTVERGKCNYINMEHYLNNHATWRCPGAAPVQPNQDYTTFAKQGTPKVEQKEPPRPVQPHVVETCFNCGKTGQFKKDCPRALHDQICTTHSVIEGEQGEDNEGPPTEAWEPQSAPQEDQQEDNKASIFEFDIEENPYNACIDPTGEDLPSARYHKLHEHVIKLCALNAREVWHSRRLQEHREQREIEALEMRETASETPSIHGGLYIISQGIINRPPTTSDDRFIQCIKTGYAEDKLFHIILDDPEVYPCFPIWEGIIYAQNLAKNEVNTSAAGTGGPKSPKTSKNSVGLAVCVRQQNHPTRNQQANYTLCQSLRNLGIPLVWISSASSQKPKYLSIPTPLQRATKSLPVRQSQRGSLYASGSGTATSDTTTTVRGAKGPREGPSAQNDRPQGTWLIVPGPIKPPRMMRKDPALLDYIEPVLEDNEEDLDSPPMSPDLDGLLERQQAKERQRYDIKKKKFNNKKKKQDLKEKAIPGCIPDTLGIVEQRQGRIE